MPNTTDLTVLFDSFGTPKYVIEKKTTSKRTGMEVVVSGKDVVNWTSQPAGTDFEVEFVDQTGAPVAAPFSNWSGAASQQSTGGQLTGKVADPPANIVYKYNVWGPSGQVLDPQIIIDR